MCRNRLAPQWTDGLWTATATKLFTCSALPGCEVCAAGPTGPNPKLPLVPSTPCAEPLLLPVLSCCAQGCDTAQLWLKLFTLNSGARGRPCRKTGPPDNFGLTVWFHESPDTVPQESRFTDTSLENHFLGGPRVPFRPSVCPRHRWCTAAVIDFSHKLCDAVSRSLDHPRPVLQAHLRWVLQAATATTQTPVAILGARVPAKGTRAGAPKLAFRQTLVL